MIDTSSAAETVDYADLYSRWERAPWAATEIDLSTDRSQWAEMGDERQRAALWNYSLFFHGEHSVAESLAPFIDAAPDAQQKYFLATQQSDEARHAVLFARFMNEVVGPSTSVDDALTRTESQLTWGFRQVFAQLDRVVTRLRSDPSLANLAAGVAMYHVIVEATLAQPGQRIIEGYLERSGLLPGFLRGMQLVSLDEQRHIGFGVKILSDLVSRDPACREAVIEVIREAVPLVTAVFVPPGWDEETYVNSFGYRLEDIYEEGMRSFEQKLRSAGLPPEELHGAAPWPMDATPRERAERALRMLRGGMIGEKHGTAARDPETVEALFDTMRLAIDHRRAPLRRLALQWSFDDHDPWYVVVDNGRSDARAGRVESPDIELRCGFDDWIDVFAGREDPRLAMLKRRIRVRGSLRSMRYLPKLFG